MFDLQGFMWRRGVPYIDSKKTYALQKKLQSAKTGYSQQKRKYDKLTFHTQYKQKKEESCRGRERESERENRYIKVVQKGKRVQVNIVLVWVDQQYRLK